MDTSQEDRETVIDLLNGWPDKRKQAKIRDQLVDLARRYAYHEGELGTFIEALLTQTLVKPKPTISPSWAKPAQVYSAHQNIHKLAQEMIAVGFRGQGMRDEANAEDFICMAADNPRVEEELPPSGFAFWRAAEFRYKVWKARKRFMDEAH